MISYNNQKIIVNLSCKVLFLVSFFAFPMIISSFLLGCNKGKDKVKSDKLVVAINLIIPPFQSIDKDGNPYGISVDLANDLATYMNKKLEIVNPRWDGILSGVRTGLYDLAIATIPITPEYEKVVDFSIPYGKVGMNFITRKEFSFNNNNLESLNNPEVRIVVRKGTFSDIVARKHFPNASLITLIDYDTAVLELLQNKADIVLSTAVTAYQYGKKYPDKISVYYHSLGARPLGIAMSKTRGKELMPEINSFLKNYIESGKMKLLSDKYLSDIREEFENQNKPFEILL